MYLVFHWKNAESGKYFPCHGKFYVQWGCFFVRDFRCNSKFRIATQTYPFPYKSTQSMNKSQHKLIFHDKSHANVMWLISKSNEPSSKSTGGPHFSWTWTHSKGKRHTHPRAIQSGSNITIFLLTWCDQFLILKPNCQWSGAVFFPLRKIQTFCQNYQTTPLSFYHQKSKPTWFFLFIPHTRPSNIF